MGKTKTAKAKNGAAAPPVTKAKKKSGSKKKSGLFEIPNLPVSSGKATGSDGAAAAYAKFAPLADQWAPSKVKPYRHDRALAAKNVATAMGALGPYFAK